MQDKPRVRVGLVGAGFMDAAMQMRFAQWEEFSIFLQK